MPVFYATARVASPEAGTVERPETPHRLPWVSANEDFAPRPRNSRTADPYPSAEEPIGERERIYGGKP